MLTNHNYNANPGFSYKALQIIKIAIWRFFVLLLFIIIISVGLIALAYLYNKLPNPYFDPTKSHHRKNGFVNLDGSLTYQKSAEERKKMIKEFRERTINPIDIAKIPRQSISLAELTELQKNRSRNSITWLGHAAALLQLGGKNILIDPMFSNYAGPFSSFGAKRITKPALLVQQLPPIDIVFISHNHYDHLDFKTILALRHHHKNAIYVVPLGVKSILRRLSFFRIPANHITELDWWDETHIPTTRGDLTLTLTPAQHWSTRYIFDRNRTLWGGAVIAHRTPKEKFQFYYSGDTGYNPDIVKAIQQRFLQLDYAMLSMGAYLPRGFMRAQHMNPYEVALTAKGLNAKKSFGVHWGTFVLSTENILAPPKDLQQGLKELGYSSNLFNNPAIGQIIWLP